jgi:tetratricopeptide (TPR) repeat protein
VQAEAFTADEVGLRRQANQPAALAGSLNNLAGMKVNRGKLDEGLLLYKEAIEIARREYGEEHHITASLMENEANIYRMKKDYDTCEEVMGRVLAIRESIFGADSLPAAKTRLNLGAISITKKDFKRGLELTEAVLPTFRKLLGDKHMDVAQALRNRAECLKGLGDNAGALRDNQAALSIYDAVAGATAAVRLRTLLNITELQCAQGEFEKAEATANTTLKVLDPNDSEQSWWVDRFQEQRAKCKGSGGR